MLVDLDRDALQRTVAEIGADQATHVVADVTDASQTQGYVAAAVEKFGGVDIALLNAGIEGTIEPITDYPVEMFDKVMAVNVRGVFLGLKYVMPAISRRGGGSIVITSSTAGIRGTNVYHLQTRSHRPDADRRPRRCGIEHPRQYGQPRALSLIHI